MRALRAFLLGCLAGAVLVYVAAATIALAATAAGADIAIATGRVVFLAVEHSPDGSETTFGTGLALVAAACGLANAVAAWILAARIRDGPIA